MSDAELDKVKASLKAKDITMTVENIDRNKNINKHTTTTTSNTT